MYCESDPCLRVLVARVRWRRRETFRRRRASQSPLHSRPTTSACFAATENTGWGGISLYRL